jgi:hypothetical protein
LFTEQESEQLTHSSRDGSNSPAQRIEVVPGPLGTVNLNVSWINDGQQLADLFRQLVRHDRLGIRNVQMCQVDQYLSHTLVQHNRITLLHEFTDDLSFVILDNQDLIISFRSRSNAGSYLPPLA